MHIPAGPPWSPEALPKSPCRLRTLAKAGSSQKSHLPCAALRGVGADQRLARELAAGTSKNHWVYKVLTMPDGHGWNAWIIMVFEHFADLLSMVVARSVDNG